MKGLYCTKQGLFKIKKCPYFFWFDPYLDPRAEIIFYFCCCFWRLKTISFRNFLTFGNEGLKFSRGGQDQTQIRWWRPHGAGQILWVVLDSSVKRMIFELHNLHPRCICVYNRGHLTTTWTGFGHFWPPPCVDSFYTLSMDKNRHFLTPRPTYLVHVVIEWPLIMNLGRLHQIFTKEHKEVQLFWRSIHIYGNWSNISGFS